MSTLAPEPQNSQTRYENSPFNQDLLVADKDAGEDLVWNIANPPSVSHLTQTEAEGLHPPLLTTSLSIRLQPNLQFYSHRANFSLLMSEISKN